MALSLAEAHKRRVERLVVSVKAYALEAGIPETAASRRILNSSKELERLEKGGLLSPRTLEAREKTLADRRRALRAMLQAESAA